ncbi:glycerol-3-phosphate dehydrogenase/oxidase [Marinobacter sp.]|uniref:glycerol-3-phosphate dehydrogenase/oxidase n=1 Tax=Marinobacter sp. TaxID=50741 RepID=UPI003562CD2D
MTLEDLSPHYDLIVIGGGITGAGIALEAASAGLNSLLVEQKDYAWGTSSRSSKMVHGGLRYLASGHFRLTRDAVRERQRMLDELPGLVDPMRYVMPHYRKGFPGPWLFDKVLWLYDRFSGRRYRHRIDHTEILQWLPGIATEGLKAATGFTDAVTEDARLVLRLLAEAQRKGAVIRNYTRVTALQRPPHEPWQVTLEDHHPVPGSSRTLTANAVINATGAWADRLWQTPHPNERIRPLRGSHLILPFHRLPVSVSLTLRHPEDRRPVFIFPWLGHTVVGTTDLDHTDDLDQEPRISEQEVEYLLAAINSACPEARAGRQDVLSTWAGVRPVVTEGRDKAPSGESREHVVWAEDGLISVAGGKLTTWRVIARQVLLTASPWLDGLQLTDERQRTFPPNPPLVRPREIGHLTWRRLQGYYGQLLSEVLAAGPLEPIAGTPYLWAELHWAARAEGVVHLDDLLIRRTRLGLLTPEGGDHLLEEVRQRLQPELNWSDERWQNETDSYRALWREAFALPAESASP